MNWIIISQEKVGGRVLPWALAYRVQSETTRTLADQLQEEDTHGTVAEGERGVVNRRSREGFRLRRWPYGSFITESSSSFIKTLVAIIIPQNRLRR